MSEITPETVKRRIWFWTVAIFVVLTAVTIGILSTANKSSDPLTAEERAWLKNHPKIRFAADPDFPPTEYFDSRGKYSGMTADYLALLEKNLGIRFKIIRLHNWDEVINQAKNRQIDIFTATATPQRINFALFTSPYLELPAAIIVREKVHAPLTMEKLNGMKVSVVSGYAVQEFIARHYPEIHLDVVPDVRTGLRKVSFGTSDAFVENLATASFYIEKVGIANLRIAGESGYTYNMAFASRKDWPLLNGILEKGLAQIREAEKKAIYKKWIPLEQKTIFTNKVFQTVILVSFLAFLMAISGIIIWNRALKKQVRARTWELEKELAERTRIQEELRESEEKFRVLADTLPAGICLYRGEQIVYVNAAATELFGYSEQECLQMRFWDWVHEDFKATARERGLARQRGETVPSRYECLHTTKNGDEKWLFVSAGRIEFKGEPAGLVSFLDITERKRAEEELRTFNEVLEKRVAARTSELALLNADLHQEIATRKQAEENIRLKKQQLEDLNRTLEMRVLEEVEKNRNKDILLIHQNRQAALGETLDHIAHQWKQPLNALSLITGSLQEESLSGKLTEESLIETTGTILGLVDHMAQTINVFRDFYRPEKEMIVFSIKDAIDNALTFIRPALRLDSIEVDLDADPVLAAYGYPKEYAQVLLNILSNFRETAKERGVKKPKVSIQAVGEEGKAVVTVTDNAGGIPDATIGRIFDLYFTTRESSGGTGIGLYMSKNIIEKNMGGKLTVRNTDCGAAFRIELVMPVDWASGLQPVTG